MIYHNTITRTAKTALAPFYALTHEILRHPLKTAENRADEFYGREWLCTRLTGCRFQTRKPSNHQNTPFA